MRAVDGSGGTGSGAADWIDPREALARILREATRLGAVERPLLDCLGSVTAEAIRSRIDLPLWPNSAMDGFAVRGEDARGASASAPRELAVVDDVPAGAFPTVAIGPGEATRIMTGAPMPEGADCVIRVEHTDGGHGIGTPAGRVRIRLDSDVGRNVRPRGEDLRRGEVALPAGRIVRASEIGVASSVGRATLRVVRRPLVAVLATGDELVEVEGFDEVLAGRRIVSSNSYTLAALLRGAGMETRLLGIARDDPDSLADHLEAARGCDVLITSAGVSVGERDLVRAALENHALAPLFWRLKARPGSAMAAGRLPGLDDALWFGLPGNPVSTMVSFELFVRPALLAMAGHTEIHRPTTRARLRSPVGVRPGATHFLRATLERTSEGVWADLTGTQSSGALTSMARADGLLVVAEHATELPAGADLPAILLDGAPLVAEPGF